MPRATQQAREARAITSRMSVALCGKGYLRHNARTKSSMYRWPPAYRPYRPGGVRRSTRPCTQLRFYASANTSASAYRKKIILQAETRAARLLEEGAAVKKTDKLF